MNETYVVEGKYDGKWEVETYSEGKEMAKQDVRDYRENVPGREFRYRRVVS